MSRERFERAREIFVAAAQLPAARRAAFLDDSCGDDLELRGEVEDLLRFHSDGGTGVSDETPLRIAELPPETPECIDRYRLLRKVGEGGMGVVYEAEQRSPIRRHVALKVIKWGMDTRQVVARFESERQALALMDHPSIARVYDGGATEEGRPFFVMEYVAGVPISDYCDHHRLDPRQRLKLFVRVCHGVQHAHQKGVIHRDLKPSNILVADGEEGPEPKIIDFGIAKATSQRLTERTVFTELGQWIGTPEYMSPEQARLTGLDVDTRTDVYSLGVMLYELLVGTQPFSARELRSLGFDEMRRKICEQPPPRPSTRLTMSGEASTTIAQARSVTPVFLRRLLRGDLDWITMKALEKDRNRRYGSPAELAADIERHLHDQPVAAGPPSAGYRLRKFVRRNRASVIAAGLVLAALVGGLTVATVGMLKARRAEALANAQVELLIGLFDAMDPGGQTGGAADTGEILAAAAQRIDGELGTEPLVQARLQETVGRIQANLGDHEEARRILEQALSTRQRELEPGHPEIIEALRSLGSLLGLMGEYQEAISHLRQALDLAETGLGEDHILTADVLHALAFELWRDGQFVEAKRLFERALPIREAAFGPDDPAVASTLYMQAVLLRDMGELEMARRGFERALEIREAVHGPDHTQVAWTVLNYGLLLELTGDREGARRNYQRALEIQTSVFGPDHFSTIEPTLRLGNLDAAAGDVEGASRRYRATLDVQQRIYGPDHHVLAGTLEQIGWLAFREGEFEAAMESFERALEILEAAFDDTDPRVSRARLNVAWALLRLGEISPARRLYAANVDLEVSRIEGGTAGAGRSYWNLGCMAALVGEHAEAVEWLNRAIGKGVDPALLIQDGDLDGLRKVPAFERLLIEVRAAQ